MIDSAYRIKESLSALEILGDKMILKIKLMKMSISFISNLVMKFGSL